jgi:hypothetical protein
MKSEQIHWALRLYPETWRARYADEFAALLEQQPLTLGALWDMLLGALDAHIAPQDTTGRVLNMLNRPRRTAITVFAAYIAFVLAGMGFQKMSEYDDFMEAARAHAVIGVTYNTILVTSAISLLAVLAGGVPIAFAVLRSATASKRYGIVALFAVPPAALLVVGGYLALLVHVIWPNSKTVTIHSALGVTFFLSLVAVFVAAAVVSTAAVSLAVALSEIDAGVLRFALGPATVTTVAMGVMFLATLIWGLSLRADVPQLFNGDGGVAATSTALSWLGIVIVMGVATAVAAAAMVRGLRARQGSAVYA